MERVVNDLEQQHEELRGDVNQFKEQVSKILKMSQPMKSPNGNAFEQPHDTLAHPPGLTMTSKHNTPTPYGLPPGYIPLAITPRRKIEAIEGANFHDFNVANLCLVLDIIISPKFKLSKFDKYKGNTCLR
ncbi:hypothetical protein CR513_61106, partial [Mucuna pruriens]